MRVFVTGGSGMVGRSVVEQLTAAGHQVSALTRGGASEKTLSARGAEPVRGDVSQPNSWRDAAAAADALIHMAQEAPSGRIGKSAVARTGAVDEIARRALIEIAKAGQKTLVYTSGVFIYGGGAEPHAESDALHAFPLVEYKVAGEREVLASASGGAKPMVLRLGAVYAPWGNTEAFYLKAMKKGKSAGFPGDGKNTFSNIHHADCARAYVACVTDPSPGEIFNVCDDRPAAVADFVGKLASAMGAPKPKGAPAFIIKLATGYLAAPLLAHNVMSNQKIKQRYRLTLAHPTIDSGVRDIATAYQKMT
jgi:nucleoside-diphosphate-sugar epimerase